MLDTCTSSNGTMESANPTFQTEVGAPGRINPSSLNLAPWVDIVPGWRLTLDVTAKGYWFAVTDTTDPCGFSFVSNERGLILKAEPIR